MDWSKAFELLKLCNTPATIYSPFPIFAISLFFISHKELSIHSFPVLLAGIVISLLLTFPSNLWNHCNDLKEDIAQGKKTILTQDISIKNAAIFISVLLYACAILFAYYLSNEFKRPIYIFSIIWMLATWWYSDSLILRKLIGLRLKDNYIGELIAYSIAMPMFTLSVWFVYSDLNPKGIIITIAIFLSSIAGLLLKDLKDISGDRKTGLKTFGVVFPPSQLIRYSCNIMILYYLIILNPFTLNFFSRGILIMFVPFIYFFKNSFFHMFKKCWILDVGDLKAIKGIGYSVYASVIFFGLSSFF
jgi:1,4-dihydroxy-2-naphthoate octaprenyltransferase